MSILYTVITLLVFLFLWMGIDFSYGRLYYRRKFQERQYPIRQSHIQVIGHGDELFHDLFTDITNAKKHIHILFYIIKNDSFSQKFLTLLQKKAAEGVEVRLLLDWAGGYKIAKKEIKKLQANGGQFFFSHKPTFPFFFYTLQARNHRKITVIDGKIGYLGGYNVGKEYIGKDPKLSPWRDYHLKITGEGVQDLQMEFFVDWLKASKVDLRNQPLYFPPLPKGEAKHQFVPTEGFSLETAFIQFLNQAKKKVVIGTPYFIPSKRVFAELLQLLRRDVEIIILVPQISDHLLVKEASYPYFRILIKRGAKVYQFLNGFYHTKMLMIDDEICDIGTANFDKRSLYINHEMNCFIYHQPVIEQVKHFYHKDLANSSLMSLNDLYQLKFKAKMKESLATAVSDYL